MFEGYFNRPKPGPGRRVGQMAVEISYEDQEYIARRNALIPIAEAWTNRAWGAGPSDGFRLHGLKRKEWCARWSRTFANRMTEMVKEGAKCARKRG